MGAGCSAQGNPPGDVPGASAKSLTINDGSIPSQNRPAAQLRSATELFAGPLMFSPHHAGVSAEKPLAKSKSNITRGETTPRGGGAAKRGLSFAFKRGTITDDDVLGVSLRQLKQFVSDNASNLHGEHQ